MADKDKAVKLVVALAVGGLLAALLLPTVIGAMTGPSQAAVTLDTGETYEAEPGLNVTLDDTTAGASASYSVTAGNDSASPTINEGENETVTVNDADVTIGVLNATASAAETSISTPTTYGWGGGATALWGILPVLIVLAVFLYFVFVAVQR